MLDRVPDLVRGDRHGRDRTALVDGLRKVHRAVARVVVIRERPTRSRLDRDVVEPVVLQDHLRHLLAGHPVRDRDLHLPCDRRLQPVLDPKAYDEGDGQEDDEKTDIHELEGYQRLRPSRGRASHGCIFEVLLLYIG